MGSAVFVHWLRRTHGWFGLWGALLGLMTGVSGVWLNHRAVLKLELPDQQHSSRRLPLPEPAPATPQAMAAWLQGVLATDRPPSMQRVERARPAPWADGQRTPMQPERWLFVFGGPNKLFQVEYWAGTAAATLRTTDNGLIATLTNFHKGVGMPVPWILLIDTLAGSLVFLSLSGALLWWFTNRRRRLGLAIFGLSVATTATLALWPLQA